MRQDFYENEAERQRGRAAILVHFGLFVLYIEETKIAKKANGENLITKKKYESYKREAVFERRTNYLDLLYAKKRYE